MKQSIVFTGWGELKDGTVILRDKLYASAKWVGYDVATSVTKNTRYLVVGHGELAKGDFKWTAKTKKAFSMGVKMITYDEFVGNLRSLAVDPVTFGVPVSEITADEETL